ncbi:MAG TPA: histidine phosphatase family protein, partial [Erythrobacter sp.]|nr:histidine phosphatase family protein [Erythrobacter sp.]
GDMLFELVAPKQENALYDEAKVKFPTAAYAVFELDIDDWSELRTGCGVLAHFARPRDLDAELGPEY